MKKINSIREYAKKINRLDYFSKKIVYDSYFTITERRELDEIQKQIEDYEERKFNGQMPKLKEFVLAFISEMQLPDIEVNENKSISKKTMSVISNFIPISIKNKMQENEMICH